MRPRGGILAIDLSCPKGVGLNVLRSVSTRLITRTTLTFAVLLIASLTTIAFSSVASAAQSCDPNERYVTDADGKRFLELRWPIDSVSNLVRLRVPAEYVTWADTGCQSAAWPGYPDPNYTNRFAVGFSVGLSLPDPKPLPPADRNIFTRGLDWTKMTVLINSTARAAGGEKEKQKIEQRSFNNTRDIYLNPENTLLKKAHLSAGQKPDKYGLKRFGAIGDMGHFKNELGGDEAIDFFYVDRDPIDLWFKCGAEEIKDHTEDPAWRKRPECEMHFRHVRLDAMLEINFPRVYMPIWPQIKEQIEQLLDSFEIAQLNEGKL
jgi:hypothetical protein